jgi:hypothetical protein
VSAPDGGPAFPGKHPVTIRNLDNPNEVDELHVLHGGMTLRDYFAARVMQAFLSTPAMLCGAMKGNESHDAAEIVAQAAYEQADAMIAHRAKVDR